jgi:hypothetical protein
VADRGEVITLLDEHGQAHDFSLVDVIEVDRHRYAILQPLAGEGVSEDDPAVVFRVEGETLVAVEDEEEFRKVADAIEAESGYDEVEVLGEDSSDDEGGAVN